MPAWIDCPGFPGVLAYSHQRLAAADDEDTHLLVRGLAFPDAPRSGYAVIVDLQVNEAIRQQLRRETGVELKSVSVVPPKKRDRRAAAGRAAAAADADARAGGDRPDCSAS